jgi:hypothetical protein
MAKKDKKQAKKSKKAKKVVKATKAKKATKLAVKAPATKPVVKTTSIATSKPFEPDKSSLIEPEATEKGFEHDPLWETIEKVSFLGMCDILHAMSDGFMRRETKDEAPNERFMAAWRSTLAIAGWSEDEFWMAYDLDNPCPECGGDLNDEDEEELPKLKPAIDPMAN